MSGNKCGTCCPVDVIALPDEVSVKVAADTLGCLHRARIGELEGPEHRTTGGYPIGLSACYATELTVTYVGTRSYS